MGNILRAYVASNQRDWDEHLPAVKFAYNKPPRSSDCAYNSPFVDLKSGWKKEEEGMQHWPPTMYGDMAEYLVANGEFRIHMQPCCRCPVQDGPRMGNRGHKQVLYIKTSRMDQAQEERKHTSDARKIKDME
ncbi:hypothetical protein Bbelb_364070 [Branchiostoma belcheri]|nr:hypothetical protein Bbelb_364070 [Branchiostoma belcheri]